MPELTYLNVPGKRDPIRIKDTIGDSYWDVGICLLNDKDGSTLNLIKADHGRIHDKVTEMFRLWLRGKGQKDGVKSITWSKLTECLKKAQLLALADEITSVLCGRKRVPVIVDLEHNEQPFKEKRDEPTTLDTIDLDMTYPSEGINK